MRLFAYLDPGTGSLFIQAIIGGVLAVVVTLRSFIKTAFYKIKMVFSRQKIDDEEA